MRVGRVCVEYGGGGSIWWAEEEGGKRGRREEEGVGDRARGIGNWMRSGLGDS